MIHIVFGESATAGLRHAFRGQSHKVIGFPIDFSVGPITGIHENNGIENYFAWLKSSYRTEWNEFKDYEKVYRQSLQTLLEIKDGEHVTIWTCENATEQIGFRIICYLLKDSKVNLNAVNTYSAMLDFSEHKDVRTEIRLTGECSAEQLAYFYEFSVYPVSEKKRRDLEQDGKKQIQSTSLVRSWQQGEIIDEAESRDDKFIMDCVRRLHCERRNTDFIITPRVIGEVIGHSEHTFSDLWIEYRIRSLIGSGQLIYEGNLQSMRKYKIKIAA